MHYKHPQLYYIWFIESDLIYHTYDYFGTFGSAQSLLLINNLHVPLSHWSIINSFLIVTRLSFQAISLDDCKAEGCSFGLESRTLVSSSFQRSIMLLHAIL